MLEVRDGKTIAVATREAVPGDDLRTLERDVLTRFRQEQAEEATARKDAQRLYLSAIRHISRFLGRGTRQPGFAVGLRPEDLDE